MEKRKPKAVALLSGGLDSALAAKLVKDQGVEVIGLHLLSSFACRSEVTQTAKEIEIPLITREKGEEYLKLLKNPQFGYGRGANPCIDCRLFMFQMGAAVVRETGADFLITGEVLGQRPLSQHRQALELTEERSDLRGRILRPLCAHSLAPTIPENEGWVDRNRLFRITGRGRRTQYELAQQFGITAFNSPGGGCLLTERGFSSKVHDFLKHEFETQPEARLLHPEMLKVGRHFRLSPHAKVIVSRNAEENRRLENWAQNVASTLFRPNDFQGPLALAFGTLSPELNAQIAAIMLRYGKRKESRHNVRFSNGLENGTVEVKNSLTDETLESIRL